MDSLVSFKALIVSIYASLLLKSQKGYPMQEYNEVKLAMESVNFIENYTTDPTSIYYIPGYRVTTIVDYHTRILNQL